MKLKIVNFRKFITSIVLFITVIMLICIIFSGNVYSKSETQYKKETIIFGETLWDIAKQEKETNKYYSNKDIRYVVYDIQKFNNLTNNNIKEGQEIYIPTYNKIEN